MFCFEGLRSSPRLMFSCFFFRHKINLFFFIYFFSSLHCFFVGGTTWGVNCLLLFVDSISTSSSLSTSEKMTLNRGEPLVTSDPQTGRIVIRVSIKSYTKERSSGRDSSGRECSPEIETFRFDASDFMCGEDSNSVSGSGSGLRNSCGSNTGNYDTDNDTDGSALARKKDIEREKEAGKYLCMGCTCLFM